MKEEDDILVSRYLAGDLPEREQQEVKQRLETDPEFAKALRMRQQEDNFLRTEADLPDLRAKMAALAGEHFPNAAQQAQQGGGARVRSLGTKKQGEQTAPPAKTRSVSWWQYAASGAVAAMLILALWLWNPFSGGADYQQFAQYEPLSLTEKSTGPDGVRAASIDQAFNEGEYAIAYELLTDYLATDPDNNQARLALGIAALETGRDAEAKAIFTELANGQTSYRDDGQFYLALTLFKAADPAARQALEKISADNPDYGVRVREMLQLVE